ncbi:SRPBCC domain-containing protein [Actinomyces sp.]|uniref:SRPBCC family protein n=1 Tax=Actinomyces sp. TaxID=29317 RepID=UPI00289B04C5|nr:SRPBCC domain-containing protein [Actinomyces sp.]
MMRDSVSVGSTIGASAGVVWRFLTVQRDTWWPDMRFGAAVGAPLVETWTESGQVRSATGSVTRCEEARLLAFRWGEPGWACPLDVMIRLLPQGRSTRVTIEEAGFRSAGVDPALPDEHEEGWRHHLARLRRASEAGGGAGAPQ